MIRERRKDRSVLYVILAYCLGVLGGITSNIWAHDPEACPPPPECPPEGYSLVKITTLEDPSSASEIEAALQAIQDAEHAIQEQVLPASKKE